MPVRRPRPSPSSSTGAGVTGVGDRRRSRACSATCRAPSPASSSTPDAETAAEIGTDPGLAASVDGIAVATAFGPTSSDAATDYAVATVVHLRPGVFDDDWFRDWRDSFDAGVCAQAGAVSGHAEATIDGHQAFIGTCAGGVHTWHVHLAGPDVVVSIQGVGPGRFGERIVDGLSG